MADPFAAGTVSPDGRIGFAVITFDRPSTSSARRRWPRSPTRWRPHGRGRGRGRRRRGVHQRRDRDLGRGGGRPAGRAGRARGGVRTVLAALVPIALTLVAVAAGLGAITLLASAMEVSSAAPTIGAMIELGVGIDYALFAAARYREHRAAGQDNLTALSNAGSAGSAVLLAGGTVVVAMAALVLTGLGFLASIGSAPRWSCSSRWPPPSRCRRCCRCSAAASTPGGCWAAGAPSETPGDGLVALCPPRPAGPGRTWSPPRWCCWRWPPGADDEDRLPGRRRRLDRHHLRRAYDLLADGFGPASTPLLLVADLRSPGVDTAIPALAEHVAADPGIAMVGQPRTSPAGDTVVLPTVPTTAPADPETSATRGASATSSRQRRRVGPDRHDRRPHQAAVRHPAHFRRRHPGHVVPAADGGVPLRRGAAQGGRDDLLSIGGAYGVVVAVFQWGWLGDLFDLDRTYLIASPMPIIFFAVLFGLSMDYEVSCSHGSASTTPRVTTPRRWLGAAHRARDHLGRADHDGGVRELRGRPSPLVKMLGLGLSTAIVLDATIVRMVLVPATMALMGRANWWLPSWLDRRLPHVRMEDADVPGQPEPVLVSIPERG